MVLRLLHKTSTGVHDAAQIVAFFSIVGIVIGYLRDRAFVHFIGPSEVFDVYIASFKIADTLLLISLGFLSVAAITIMCERKKRDSEEELKHFVTNTFYIFSLFLLIVGLILWILIPHIVSTFFSEIGTDIYRDMVLYSRLLLIQAVLFSLSYFFTAVLTFKRRFVTYGLVPIVYNIGIIFGAMYLFSIYGGIGLVYGVLIGTLFAFLIQGFALLKTDILHKPTFSKKSLKDIINTVKISTPFAVISIANHGVNIMIIGYIFAISSSTLSIYYFADALHAIPFSIIVMAYAIASLPTLIKLITENRMDDFFETINSVLKTVIFILAPLVAIIFVISREIVHILFQTGEFVAQDTIVTSIILMGFIFHIIPFSFERLYIRFFMVTRKIKQLIPIYLSIIGLKVYAIWWLTTNITEDSSLIQYIYTNLPLTEYSHALLLIVVVTLVLFEILLVKSIGYWFMYLTKHNVFEVAPSFIQHMGVSFIAGTVMWFVSRQFNISETYLNSFIEACVVVGVGGIVWYILLTVLKNKELSNFKDKIKEKIYGKYT